MGDIAPDPNLATSSAEEVGAMLDALRNPPAPEPTPEPTEPPPAPTPEPQPEPDPAATEPPADANGANGEAVPAPSEPSLEERLEAMQHQSELDALERDKLREENRLERLLREQANTSKGALKKVATDLMREGREVPAGDPIYDDEARPESQAIAEMRREIDRLKGVEVQRAVHDAGGRFAAENPDYGDYVQDMQPHIERLKGEYSSYLDSGDPRLVAATTRLVLKTALIDAKAARLETKRSEAKAKRAEQFQALHKKKAEAAPAASGAAPPARPAPKTPQTMTADEAGAALDRMLS